MTKLAEKLSIVERGDILVITGYPDENESEWHVNSSTHFGEGPDRRAAIILQAADKSKEFLTVALERDGGEWSIDDFAVFEGEQPSGVGDEAAISLNSEDIDLVRVE